jgi:hypothetical protein
VRKGYCSEERVEYSGRFYSLRQHVIPWKTFTEMAPWLRQRPYIILKIWGGFLGAPWAVLHSRPFISDSKDRVCNARSCSSLAAGLSLFLIAFWYALSAATLSGIPSVDNLANMVGIFPVDVSKLIVKYLYDITQPIELRFGLPSSAAGRNRTDFSVSAGHISLIVSFTSLR